MRVADRHLCKETLARDRNGESQQFAGEFSCWLDKQFMKDSSSRRRSLCQAGPHALLARVTYG
jgi:hypothetical protein